MAYEHRSLLISLADAVSLLKNSLRTYAEDIVISNRQCKHVQQVPINFLQDYNHLPFINKLIEDMFNGHTMDLTSEIPPSTMILVKDGADVDTAKLVALNVFTLIVSAISAFVPDINFMEDGYRIEVCDAYDLLIAPPYNSDNDDGGKVKHWNEALKQLKE